MTGGQKYKPQENTAARNAWDENERLLVFRVLVIICLLAAAVVGGYGSHYQVYHYETKLQHSDFSSIAEHFRREVTSNLRAKALSIHALSSTMSMACPSTESWPNCTIPMDSYANISWPLIVNSNMRTLSYAPIITASQVDEFESFAYDFYESEGHPDVATFSFGKGISAVNHTTGLRYHDKVGYQYGENKILVPLLQVGDLPHNQHVAMFNLYSEANRANVIDHIIGCFNESPQRRCTSATDTVFLIQDTTFRPAVLVMHPISPRLSPSVMTGLVQSVYNWDTVFTDAIPEYVSSLDVVLSGGSSTYTFRIHCGKVTLAGEGDLHESKYSSQGHSFTLDIFSGRVDYTLSIYPTQVYADEFHTDNPWYAMAVVVSILILTSGFFFLYDKSNTYCAMTNELRAKIDTKRLFVRFISHEIRTPLNTVHVGLKLLVSEMMSFLSADHDLSPGTVARVNDWVGVIRDIDASSDSAIIVLNDLLNYDKISLGTLTADFRLLSLWDIVRDTAKAFHVQARSSGVSLIVNLEVENDELPTDRRTVLQRLAVVGDKAKLSQVIRNLLSNALKFSHDNSVVEVRVHWEEEGLQGATVPFPKLRPVTPPTNASMLGTKRSYSESTVVPSMQPALNSPRRVEHSRAGSLVVSVVDSGAGISAEDQVHLFQEGARFRVKQLQTGQGSGLGLWVSKGIVDLHAGRLVAFSNGEDKGSEFKCELPCVLLPVEGFGGVNNGNNGCNNEDNPGPVSIKIERLIDSYHAPSRIGSSAGNHLLSGTDNYSNSSGGLLVAMNCHTDVICNVMVVDDSGPSRKVLARLLRNNGYDCCEAVDGQDCLEQMHQRLAAGAPINLVLMDFEMPRMNGPEATSLLRASGFVIPIIGVTGNVLPADKDFFIAHGANAVLHKPLSIEQLQAEIARLNRAASSSALSQGTGGEDGVSSRQYSTDDLPV